MKRLFVVLLIIYSHVSYGRDHTSDTLRTTYADSLLNHANAIYYSNPDSSLYLSTLALDYAVKHNLDVQKALAWRSMAKTEILRGDIEPALQRLKNAIAIFEKHHLPEYVAKCYGHMSTALSKVNNNAEAIRLLLKSCAIYRQIKNTAGLTGSLVNLANSYIKVHEYDKAMEAVNESKLYTAPGSTQWYYYYINAGLIHMGQKKYAEARSDFDSGIVISRRHNMLDAEITAITEMAELYRTTKKFTEASDYFNKAIVMARNSQLPLEESDALTGLMKCSEVNGDYHTAFICQNRLKAISDSLFNIEKIKNISTIEARLKMSEKEKTIALQKLDMHKSAVEHEESHRRITMLIAGTTFLAIMLFFTFYVYIKTRRQKREVELQKTRAERLNSLNQKIFAVIAHDFKSPMITLNMLMDLMDKDHVSREDLSAYSADVRNQIIQSGQILDNLLNWAKTELNLSHSTNLRASPFLISEEIIRELRYVSSRKNISISNAVPPSLFLKVPPDILRIITRNLVSNAVKFSYSNSTVSIGVESGHTLMVEDNGAGINEALINNLFNGTVQSRLGTFNETGFGLGLYITYELIRKFNGKIMVEKNQPTGTVFKFVLPLDEQH